MQERDLILIPELELWAKTDEDLSLKRSALNTQEEQAYSRRRFHIHPNDFTVLLLGKDGGEKFRSHTPITMERLTQIIDAMPMRRQEMRSRHTP